MGLLDGLEVYFQEEEASGTRFDATRNNYDLATNNGFGTAAGKLGLCADIRGGGSYLFRASAPLVNFADEDFTLSCHCTIETATQTSNQGMVGKWDATGNQRAYFLRFSTVVQRWVFGVSSIGGAGGSTTVDSVAAPPINGTFQHVICIHDSVANQIVIRVDDSAQAVAAHSAGINVSSTAEFQIGRVGVATPNFSLSKCDEVGLWRRRLSAAEITSLHNGGAGLAFSNFTSDVGLAEAGHYNFYWNPSKQRA